MYTAQRISFSIKYFISKCDQVHNRKNKVTNREALLNKNSERKEERKKRKKERKEKREIKNE